MTSRALAREFPEAEISAAGDPATFNALAAQPFDMLVSDYMLNWSDGFAILERVKAAAPDCCAVMFTGTGNEDLAVRAIKAGFDDYIVKTPQQQRRLAAAVRLACERRQEVKGLRERRELLLAELYHRLHNNLQIVIGLVRRTARGLSNPRDRDALLELNRRIQAIALLQEAFYRGDRIEAVPFDAYLRRLSAALVETAPQVELDLALAPILMPVDKASPLGLIANELISNSLKHAFGEGRPGRLAVGLRREHGRCVLSVSDDGQGSSGDTSGQGMGSELIRGLAGQIDATVQGGSTGAGWSTTVAFAL